MRAGLSTIQQTLTPEAATILTHSISESTRRNHGQTTPLHVAATLLSSTSGYLRQACIRSHPNSSHPLQCRALELCFSVALERLPTAQSAAPAATEPPISNALMAALKRAQAHQRRGCPEQQQQPLLAVKVELDQLIISILDDPSVSRVMREAGFSSPAVKASIEKSVNSSSLSSHGNVNFCGIDPRMLSSPVRLATMQTPLANRNMYLNPRLQRVDQKGCDEVNKVLDIMLRSKKRNPVLVGDSEPEIVVKELLRKIENKEFENDGVLRNVQVVSVDKGFLSDTNRVRAMIEDLGGVIESRIDDGGVIVDLGDLKWLVERFVGVQQHQQQVITETVKVAVVEMAKLLGRFGNKLWLIGTATCETYLRCQVYHSNMESDWDLQAVPMAPKLPLPGIFPRLGTERLLSNPVEPLNPLKANPMPLPALTRRLSENSDPAQRTTFCPQCSENCEKELAKLTAIEKSFSEAKQETNRPSLPQWLQNAKTKDQSQGKTQELQKKWRDTCLNLHPNFHQNSRLGAPALSMTNLYNPNLLVRPPFQPKLLTTKLQLNTNHGTALPAQRTNSPPGSPVRTDLVLGRKENEKLSIPEKISDDRTKDFSGCISSKLIDKFSNALDADTYKKLLKDLMEKAWWQAEAATEVASAITRCRLGNGKRRGGGSRGDVWLLFTGPDRAGKKKMASVLAEQICGASLITICLGARRDDEELDTNLRGKTVIDRIAEAVRRNPFSVILLEDIDEADLLVRGSVKRAVERGRLGDSHGREVGLGNCIFVLTGDWSTTSPEALRDGHFVDEKKLASIASGNWELGLIVREKSAKRRPSWLHDENRPLRPRKEPGSNFLNLNLALRDIDDDKTEGSHNSSDVTIDHEDDHRGLVNGHFSITSVPHELVNIVDDSIVFKPVDSAFVRGEIKKTISLKFSMVVDDNLSIEVEDDVLEKILGGLWHDPTSLQEWIENVVGPGFDRVKPQLPPGDKGSLVVRLVVESDSGSRDRSRGNGEWLPSSILV